jgi:hypothetical protein
MDELEISSRSEPRMTPHGRRAQLMQQQPRMTRMKRISTDKKEIRKVGSSEVAAVHDRPTATRPVFLSSIRSIHFIREISGFCRRA